jgi:exopolyphosphatase/pppGpp-phosphohydrolase
MQENSIAPAYAAIDIGSNTIRIVIGRYQTGHLHIIADDESFVGLGADVNTNGTITAAKQDQAISVLQRFQSLAKQHHTQNTIVVATEAVRKATNREEFLAHIHSVTGLTVDCISGEVEALLTFYGVTSTLSNDTSTPSPIAVMDLGGGSMELVFASGQHIDQHTSLPIGSGWLTNRYLASDPPTPDDVATAQAFLTTFFTSSTDKRSILPQPTPSVDLPLFVTGGSAQSLLSLVQRTFKLRDDSATLTRDELLRCEGLFQALSSEQIAQRYNVDVKRARVLPAGSLIIRAIMQHFHLQTVQVSMRGIREGVLLAYSQDGDAWLKRVQQQSLSSQQADQNDESFISSGRALLHDYARKMLSWREDVLKHEDIEAVHKMRVATRRLRAAMDAYQSICEPKQFQKVYTQVKRTADVLGQARDTDVMIADLQQRLQQIPPEDQTGIQWLIDRLTDYRTRYQHDLDTYLQGLDEDAFMHQLGTCLPQKEVHHGKS